VICGDNGFADQQVGAVQIQVRMVNRGTAQIDGDQAPAPTRLGRLLVTLQDLEFRTVIAAMQHLRHRMSSAGMGGNGQFSRLSTLNAVAGEHGTPWHGALLEDFEFGLHVLMTGLENRYCDDTWVAQEGLPEVRKLIRQRTRWAQGGMQCAKYLKPILTSPNLSTSSALEIAYFLLIPWTQILGTLVYAGSLAAIAGYAITTPGGLLAWFGGSAWVVLPPAVVFGVVPIAIWALVYRWRCERNTSWCRVAILAAAYWLYNYLMLIAVWSALARLIRSKNGWVKTARVPATFAQPASSPTGWPTHHAYRARPVPRPLSNGKRSCLNPPSSMQRLASVAVLVFILWWARGRRQSRSHR
jgi:hypothetical protein